MTAKRILCGGLLKNSDRRWERRAIASRSTEDKRAHHQIGEYSQNTRRIGEEGIGLKHIVRVGLLTAIAWRVIQITATSLSLPLSKRR